MRYAITNLDAFPTEQALNTREGRRLRLLRDLRRWAAAAVDFVQLREKGLAPQEVFGLASTAVHWLREFPENEAGGRLKLLVNGRADVAAAAGADGVHLTAQAGELRPEQVHAVFRAAGLAACTVSVSCHSLEEVSTARSAGVDLILFGPVFEKRVGGEQVREGTGLQPLRRACEVAGPTPVLALGGVTSLTVDLCLRAGAAGVAGIRLFD